MADAEHSKDLNADEAIPALAEFGSADEVRAFVEGDTRKTVLAAADARVAELGGGENLAALEDSYVDRPAPPEARQGKPLDESVAGKVIVRTRYPIDRFDSGLSGVPVITKAGVEVDGSHVAALLEAAASADTELEEVEG